MILLKMMIRFEIGLFALTGDLQQFYCSCKLHADMMNLTRFLYSHALDVNSEPQECVFQALGFGMKSANAQSETVKQIVANEVKKDEPDLAMMLEFSTYVDDMGESKPTKEELVKLIDAADTNFA